MIKQTRIILVKVFETLRDLRPEFDLAQGQSTAKARQAKKSPVVKPGFERILETGVSRGSKETTGALQTLSAARELNYQGIP